MHKCLILQNDTDTEIVKWTRTVIVLKVLVIFAIMSCVFTYRYITLSVDLCRRKKLPQLSLCVIIF